MKNLLTANLLKFTLSAIVLTILFRISLSLFITNKLIGVLLISAIAYGILMWISGCFFGKKDYENLPIHDVGFRFHLATFLAHNLISILWFTFGFQSKYEDIGIIYLTAGIWGVFLLAHFIYYLSMRKSTVNNLGREDLFE